MIVLGIDPGTAACGYGLVEQTAGRLRLIDFGCFTTSPSRSLPERLESIHAALTDLIALHRPDVMGVERLFFSKNAQTAFAVGLCARRRPAGGSLRNRLPIREGTSPNESASRSPVTAPRTRSQFSECRPARALVAEAAGAR